MSKARRLRGRCRRTEFETEARLVQARPSKQPIEKVQGHKVSHQFFVSKDAVVSGL